MIWTWQIAEKIRERVKRELGITVSIGISWNKIFAKFGIRTIGDIAKTDLDFLEKHFGKMGIDSCGMLMSAVHNVAGEENGSVYDGKDSSKAGKIESNRD